MVPKTPQNRVLFRRCLKPAGFGVFALAVFLSTFLFSLSKPAVAATNNTINFQARLMTSGGAIVADNPYNIVFNLYDAETAGNLLWTEQHLSVQVLNGYLNVELGSITAFPSTIDWSQNLYLTMNVNADGEMSPRLHLTAVPHAFTSDKATQLAAGASSLTFTNPVDSNSIALPDASGTVCLQGSTACGFAVAGGSGAFINNGTSVQAANFYVQAATSGSVAGKLEANSTGTGDILELQNGSGVNVATFGSAGSVLLKPSTNATNAFQIQPSGSTTAAFDVDTINSQVGIGISAPTRTLDVAASNTQTTAPMQLLEQAGTGDATLEFKTPAKSFIIGEDASDASKFKISSSTASATSTTTFGKTTSTGTLDSGSGTVIGCQSFTPASSGVVTSLTVFESGNVAPSPNNLFQVAIYASSGGTPNAPGTLLANSASIAITANSFNTANVASTSITSGTVYWLCYQTNAPSGSTGNTENNLPFDTGAANQYAFFDGKSPSTFGIWSNPLTGPKFGTAVHAIFATYQVAGASYDSFNKSLFSLGDTGQTVFQNSTDSTSAFQVQNAAGTTLFSIDSSNLLINIGGSASTTTPTLLVLSNKSSAGDPSNGTNGAMYYNANTNTYRCFESGTWENCVDPLTSSTANVTPPTVLNCTTACAPVATATNAWPASSCNAGHIYHLFASGTVTTTGTPTLAFGVYLGTSTTSSSDTLLGALTNAPTMSSVSGAGWSGDVYISCISNTSVMIRGNFTVLTSTTTGSTQALSIVIGTATTISNTLQNIYIFPTWGTASVSNQISASQFIVEQM